MQNAAILLAIAGVIVGLFIGWFLQKNRYERQSGNAKDLHDRMIADAKIEAENIRREAEVEAKSKALQSQQQFNDEIEKARRELTRRTEFLDQRDASLDKKVAYIDQKENRIEARENELKSLRAETNDLKEALETSLRAEQRKLEEISGLSAANAKQILMDRMISDARMSAARSVAGIKAEAERSAKRETQKILSQSIQRYAAEHVAEISVSVVDLPNDDMKGRIIGREGRNIRAFEMATGVDVIIDDTPEAVIISGFDPVRRQVACLALKTLIRDGRIHPGRIEEVVQKTEAELQEKIRDIGEQACLELGLQDIDTRLHGYIGRLQYRTSYGQNLLLHSKEVAAVSAGIASELGLDPMLARRCGFLHDIGKAADHEFDGPHALVGGRLVKKMREPAEVVNAVEGHHQDVDAISPYTFITSAADAVSASRPGARRESFDTYINRLENLERIAESFEGVDKSYAIQAGREIRIMVDHTRVTDEQATLLADEISRRVEGELEYPGQIKIMVLRETRSVAYAR